MKGIFRVVFLTVLMLPAFTNLPYYPIEFPRDEGAHYANTPYDTKHLIEWWYFNGKLETDEGRTFSFANAMLYKKHQKDGRTVLSPEINFHITDIDNAKHYGFAPKYDKEDYLLSTEKLNIQFGSRFKLDKTIVNNDVIYRMKISEHDHGQKMGLDLTLKQISEPALIHGVGMIPISLTTNSYYYAIPKFAVTGTITVEGKTYHITKWPGDAWLERQWGDFDVPPAAWEWYSVRLDNGMNASIIIAIDRASHRPFGGLAHTFFPNGETIEYDYSQFIVERKEYWHDPRTNLDYPIEVNIFIPGVDLDIMNKALLPDQEKIGYWEGFCYADTKYLGGWLTGYSITELML